MPRCFVIQPFDGGKFDKRFTDVLSPAIENAGLEPYRVDREPGIEVPIDAIEAGIKMADAVLADITTNNPNVWYELGYASAMAKPLVMVCSAERTETKYPFDIHHRTILPYSVDSTQDFENIKRRITEHLSALLIKRAALDSIASDRAISIEGLSQPELIVLAAAAGSTLSPAQPVEANDIRADVLQSGFNQLAFSLGLKRLDAKRLIQCDTEYDEYENPSLVVTVTELGWQWIDRNEDKFVLRSHKPKDEIPF